MSKSDEIFDRLTKMNIYMRENMITKDALKQFETRITNLIQESIQRCDRIREAYDNNGNNKTHDEI